MTIFLCVCVCVTVRGLLHGITHYIHVDSFSLRMVDKFLLPLTIPFPSAWPQSIVSLVRSTKIIGTALLSGSPLTLLLSSSLIPLPPSLYKDMGY